MGYATLSDVESLDAALTFTAVSKPSADDVVRFINKTAAELNGVLSAKEFVTPVPTTATDAFELMVHYNALGADCLAQKAAPDSPRAKDSCAAWQQALKMLKDGAVELPGAPTVEGGGHIRIRSSASAVATPFFTREMCL